MYAAWTFWANAQLVAAPTPNPPPHEVESVGIPTVLPPDAPPPEELAPAAPDAEELPPDFSPEWVMTIAAAVGDRSRARPITSIVVVPSSTDARAENRPSALTVAGDPAMSTFASLGATIPATVTLLPLTGVETVGEVIVTSTRGATLVLVLVTVPDAPQPDNSATAPNVAMP